MIQAGYHRASPVDTMNYYTFIFQAIFLRIRSHIDLEAMAREVLWPRAQIAINAHENKPAIRVEEYRPESQGGQDRLDHLDSHDPDPGGGVPGPDRTCL